jgi:conjugal transfer mating pair stabilization protein TraG
VSGQEFYNTSDGKAFNDAYHHMISTAKNSHLDTADSHNLSGAEQIAANFSAAESLLKQSSAEYSHGEQLQTAASHATENAKSIDDNLNQPYHDWVVDKYKAHGEQVMLQTDSASIATQHQWANEFLNSSVGQSAIGSQVHEALARTGADVKHDYAADASHLSQSKNMNARFQRDSHAVDNKASRAGLAPISPEQMADAKILKMKHQTEPVVNDGVKIENYVSKQIKHTKIKIKEN